MLFLIIYLIGWIFMFFLITRDIVKNGEDLKGEYIPSLLVVSLGSWVFVIGLLGLYLIDTLMNYEPKTSFWQSIANFLTKLYKK